jgi:hypothetical protein
LAKSRRTCSGSWGLCAIIVTFAHRNTNERRKAGRMKAYR